MKALLLYCIVNFVIIRINSMATKTIKEKTNKRDQNVSNFENKKKSKIALAWEKYPNGIIEIVDMRAVLR
ncbi:hypothetical protein FACS189421_04870 [Bacteroidia bacterium]|nr:hypothetical protein FACS189421_04870 [Bacteroidia bacterium]GHT02904.1 hypothetical protein FACS189423_02560 [Bacteroidia bacterium]